MKVKKEPNTFELELLVRTKKYVRFIAWIPGIEMVAVVNSLAMYATHKESDIDLFIITKPGYLWFVRVLVTGIFSVLGVWRRGEDVAGNFCLSFFITREALDFENIALENDIYLYYWIYYLKPVLSYGNAYEDFLQANTLVIIDDAQKRENMRYNRKMPSRMEYFSFLWMTFDWIFRKQFLLKTLQNNEQFGNPKGVTISEHILKFHLNDRREEIRDRVRESMKV